MTRKREYIKWGGYWWTRLSKKEQDDYPGSTWGGWVRVHKFKVWEKYGEWYGQSEARYCFLDGNPDNLRITNIGVRQIGGDWVI